MGEWLGQHSKDISDATTPIGHRDFRFDGKTLIPIYKKNGAEQTEQIAPKTIPLLGPNERGVIRIPKQNGQRRLTIVGTPDQFAPAEDPQPANDFIEGLPK